MAKKNMIEKEKKRNALVLKYSEKRKTLKESLSKANSYEEKLELNAKIQKLPRNAFPTRLRNRCWVTGRSRGYYRSFGVSRHVLREMAHACLLPGITKSSW
jgi:small subunit ribosomal protein S14